MSVFKKLQEARLKLQATKLTKSGHNKFAGYQYFELGDFLPTVQAIFNEVGLCGVISFDKEIATLAIHDIDGDGVIKVTSPMADANLKGCHPIQNLGAVETYTRRYLWVTAMEIVEHDALDAVTGADERPKRESSKSVAQGEFDQLDEETKEWMQSEASTAKLLLAKNDVEGAVSHIESLNMDNDSRTAMWALFDSKERRMFKEYKEKQA